MRMRRVAPVLLLLLLAGGSVALAGAFHTRDDHRRSEVRAARASEALGIVQRAVAHTLDAQNTLATALGNLSGSIDAPTWRRLGRPVLANASASSVAWVERVGFAERQAWERRHGLQIRQLSPQGRPVAAGARADYLVVADIAARGPMASGVDLGVDATRRAHMHVGRADRPGVGHRADEAARPHRAPRRRRLRPGPPPGRARRLGDGDLPHPPPGRDPQAPHHDRDARQRQRRRPRRSSARSASRARTPAWPSASAPGCSPRPPLCPPPRAPPPSCSASACCSRCSSAAPCSPPRAASTGRSSAPTTPRRRWPRSSRCSARASRSSAPTARSR